MGFYSERVFPVLLRRAVRSFESDRGVLLGNARGRALEIGVGGGQNLSRYPSTVHHVACLESSGTLLSEARASLTGDGAETEGTGFSFLLGRGESLPFRDMAFDTVVSFLLFCSLSDPESTAREAFRVLRPGGRFLFFEHVAAKTPGLRLVQDLVNPLWTRVSCGCNLNRDTANTFQEAGFELRELEEFMHSSSVGLGLPLIKGMAVRPNAGP